MGGSEKWDVTYTKHIKQKRKVYQDGFLELDASSQKVILYDDCYMILHSRSVKKDDIIKSGETLAFDSYLVDIGDLHGDQKPLAKFDKKVTMVSKSFQTPKFGTPTASVDRKPNLGMGKSRERNLSPSQKIIRAFKKSEMDKYDSLPACIDIIKSSKMEWQVLYTTQITQKAKKYHDGILQLLIGGSQKQILLYDVNRRLLDSRFLRKDEVIISGESITFDGHLVDVGECEGYNKPLIDLNLEGRNCNLDGKVKAQCGSIYSREKLPIEWEAMYTTQVTQKSKKYNNGILKLAMLGFFQMQVILLTQDGIVLSRRRLQSAETENIRSGSTLQLQNYLVELGDLRTSCKEKLESSGSSWKPTDSSKGDSCIDNTKLIQRVPAHKPIFDERQKETSPMTHLNSKTQNSIDKKNISALLVSKTPVRAAQEILSVLKRPMTQKNVIEMERKSVDRSHASQSSHVYTFDARNRREQHCLQDFCPEGREVVDLSEENKKIQEPRRSGSISNDMDDTGCTNSSVRPPDTPTVEPEVLAAKVLDFKGPETVSPVLLDSSANTLEKGCHIEPVSCEENPTGGVSITSCITIPSVEEATFENLNQPCAGFEGADVGWDDEYHVTGKEKANDCTSYDNCYNGLNFKTLEQDNNRREADNVPSFDLGF